MQRERFNNEYKTVYDLLFGHPSFVLLNSLNKLKPDGQLKCCKLGSYV